MTHLPHMQQPDLSPLLRAAAQGDRAAVDQLFAVTYEELKVLAHLHRRRWNGNPTLGTTVLVHEAYQKLARHGSVNTTDRSHFLAVAAQAMRQVLVNYAEQQATLKRGGGLAALPMGSVNPVAPDVAEEVLALHQALELLADTDPRRARVVECRFFAGMTIEETAEALGTSPATVKRDWVLATAWLRREIRTLTGEDSSPLGKTAAEEPD